MVAKIFDLAGRRVFVAGHRGMVGSALVRRLADVDCQVITASRDKLDLLDGAATYHYLAETKPDVAIVAAAKVGGIHANSTYPAEFIQENLGIAINTIHGSYKAGVKKLLFLGSSCIYPKLARQPMTEDELLAGPLEPTNESYAVAKIAGIKLCQAYRRQYGADFISVMPTNLYGAGDNYHPENSHVVAALIRRFHEAKQARAPSVTIWGTGTPRREFLFVDDLADACIFVLEHYSGETHLNVGTGEDTTIAEFAQTVSDIVGYEGQLTFDTTRPDGSPQKLLDVSKLDAMGWRATTPLRTGLAAAYADFLADGGRGRHDR
jgi:GDP-L-fucose synthase